MTKGEKHHAPLSLPFSVHPPKKIGNLRGGGRGGPLRACVHTLLLRHEHKFRDAWYRCTAMGKGD